MDFAVIGAGNMGCVYGANLARAGQAVTMVDRWDEHVRTMAERGLWMDGLRGSYTARVGATTDPRRAPKADVALITVNTYDTRTAALAARDLLKEEGFALTLQNGMGNVEALSEVLGPGRVMAGLTFHSGDLEGPGRVTHTNEGPTYLGELDRRKTPRLEAVVAAMDEAGMEPVVEEDIVTTIWSKFLHNCGINALCAITDLRPGHLRLVADVDACQTHLIEEVAALAAAKGIRLPDPDPVATVKAYCATKFHRVSMVQHLARGRRTEIDALNGYVARESLRIGLRAPWNEALAAMMKGREYVPEDQPSAISTQPSGNPNREATG